MLVCLVIMGYGKKIDPYTSRTIDLDLTYELILKPVIEKNGFHCIRLNEISHSGLIDWPMYMNLLKADFVIADISTANPNALYELGIRHALRPHSTIIIAEENFQIPFDLNHVNIFKYHHSGKRINPQERVRFRNELKSALDEKMKFYPREIDSPVYRILNGLKAPLIDDQLLHNIKSAAIDTKHLIKIQNAIKQLKESGEEVEDKETVYSIEIRGRRANAEKKFFKAKLFFQLILSLFNIDYNV